MDDFERLLACHGADPGAWPPAERAQAEALLRTSAAARARLVDARMLDRLLLDLPPLAAPPALAAAVLARVEAHLAAPARRPAASLSVVSLSAVSLSVWRRLWPQAAGFVAASLLGFGLGVVLGPAGEGAPGEAAGDVSAYVLGFDGESVMLSLSDGPAADAEQTIRKEQP